MIKWHTIQHLGYFKNGKVAVHCATENLAIEFLKLLKENGFIWCDGGLLNDPYFDIYKGKTCYVHTIKGLQYCYEEYYEKNGFVFIEFHGV